MSKNTNTNTLARIENYFLFNAQHGLSAREQKVVLFLISQINPLAQQFHIQTVPLKQIQSIVLDKRSGSFYEQMMGFADKMTDKKISFDTSVQFRGKNMKGYINWFQSITPVYNEVGDTCLKFKFSTDLIPFLLELNQYSQIDYNQVLPLGSGFAVRMYQVFRAHRDKMAKHQKKSKLVYDLQELRVLLGVGDKYKDWRDMKKRVVDVIEKGMKKTDIKAKVTPIRKGRKVTGIKFELSDKGIRVKVSKNNLESLAFAQLKAHTLLVAYGVEESIALEMINRVGGSEINGFEDWYIEEVIRIFETKTNQEGEAAKAGTLVNWFLKKKVFKQGDMFAKLMERLQERKKQLQAKRPQAWENRLVGVSSGYDHLVVTSRFRNS